MIEIVELDMQYCGELAKIISTDACLHEFLTPSKEMQTISATEYYQSCREWEYRKNGVNFCILANELPIGSISYIRKCNKMAAYGMWISSACWNRGYGTDALAQFKKIVKNAGFAFLTASIPKDNPRSWRVCEKLGAEFLEDTDRWYPLFSL